MNHDYDLKPFIAEWADELSAKLGRTKEHVLQNGVRAADFRSTEDIELAFPDGSSAYFHSAFYVTDTRHGLLAVFTEHCGYHVFPLHGTTVKRITREWFDEE